MSEKRALFGNWEKIPDIQFGGVEDLPRFDGYPKLAAKLIALLQEAEDIDRECSRVNGEAPSGESRRLLGVELTARNLPAFSRDQPSIAKTTQLPDWELSCKLIWPVPTVPMSVQFAAPATYMYGTPTASAPPTAPVPKPSHFGTGDWWRDNEQIKNANRAEAARIAKYYDDQARAREKREAEEQARLRA